MLTLNFGHKLPLPKKVCAQKIKSFALLVRFELVFDSENRVFYAPKTH